MEQTVREIVTLKGGRLFHVRRGDTAPELADLLDWLIVAPWKQSVLLFEAKSQKRIITPGQQEVLTLLEGCHRFESGIVRPNPHLGETSYESFMRWLEGS